MRQVAIAFTTTGPSPKQGHRISELVAVEQEDSTIGRAVHIRFRTDEAQPDRPTFSSAFEKLDSLIGSAPIVVHNAALWRKFMRIELRSIKKRGSRRVLKQVVDVTNWAHSRYPKQRKSLEAIARKCGVAEPEGMVGVRLDAERLLLIARLMRQEPKPEVAKVPPLELIQLSPDVAKAADQPVREGLIQRIVSRLKALAVHR